MSPAALLDRGGRPLLRWLALEGHALLEATSLPPALPLLLRTPRGDGHPVHVLPGLLAGDGSTWPMRRVLARLGHAVHGWRLGRDLGARDGVLDGLRGRLQRLHADSGRRVSLVGWSLGGLYEPAAGLPGIDRFAGRKDRTICVTTTARGGSG